MPVALSSVPAILSGANAPFLAALAIAVTALVCIAVTVRRLRTANDLTLSNASISAAAASLVLAAALLASVALGATSPASATNGVEDAIRPPVTVTDFQPVEIEGLEGLQLPTQ